MAKAKVQPIIKKKVQPYPFIGVLDIKGAKKNFEVIRLTPAGLIAKLQTAMVYVGEYYQVTFELPVMHSSVAVNVRTIKTYDRSVDPKQHMVERMAEFHFENLTEEHKKYIVSFLTAIGQK